MFKHIIILCKQCLMHMCDVTQQRMLKQHRMHTGRRYIANNHGLLTGNTYNPVAGLLLVHTLSNCITLIFHTL